MLEQRPTALVVPHDRDAVRRIRVRDVPAFDQEALARHPLEHDAALRGLRDPHRHRPLADESAQLSHAVIIARPSGRRGYLSRVDLLAETDGAVATFTLNRPERLNAVTPRMVDELHAALATTLADDAVRVIRLRGAGRAFCSGYDLEWAAELMHEGDLAGPWDPAADYRVMSRYVNSYMALWRSPKPVVAQVHGVCVGGGSDLALCSDLIVCAETARIGYPPARVWGSPTTAMWFHRLGLERAKRLLLTGDAMSGTTAAEWGFASGAYPEDRLDAAAMALVRADRAAARQPAPVHEDARQQRGRAAGPGLHPDARHAARRRRAPHARGDRVLP